MKFIRKLFNRPIYKDIKIGNISFTTGGISELILQSNQYGEYRILQKVLSAFTYSEYYRNDTVANETEFKKVCADYLKRSGGGTIKFSTMQQQ